MAEAAQKYERADALDPEQPNTLYHWAMALYYLDRTEEAVEKYARVDALYPDHETTLTYWALALMKLRQYEDASVVLGRVETIAPGHGSYNLACIHAVTARPDECRAALELCVARNTLPLRDHLRTDADLDSVRDTDWFRDILEQAPNGNDDEDQGE